jgi:hypothetical protein
MPPPLPLTQSVLAPSPPCDAAALEAETKALLRSVRDTPPPEEDSVRLDVSCALCAAWGPDEQDEALELVRDEGLAEAANNALLTLTVRSTGAREFAGVQLLLELPAFVVALGEASIELALVGAAAAETQVRLLVRRDRLPSTLEAKASALWLSASGEPRGTVTSFALPLGLACELIAPPPAAPARSFKLTLDSDRPPASMRPLFAAELAPAPAAAAAPADRVLVRVPQNTNLSRLTLFLALILCSQHRFLFYSASGTEPEKLERPR